ncbi:MAG TPA: Gfo/Idh/MocA family oxidoreductase [Tepidisphaeraceae bacterium]|nr:Gfo/Idh/MocA family oxidoreductase [Tepidisphaeraceae bacterium]
MSKGSNRRDFMKYTAATGMGYWVASRKTWAEEVAGSKSPNEKLNIACVGVGGKGDSDSDQVAKHANIVAICDTDDNTLNRKANKKEKDGAEPFAKAKKYNDFRKLFDEVGKQIDGVTVSIPDHMHAVVTMTAIKMGKGTYTQKPLAHDVSEARALRLAAREYKVATQMGNQGTASSKLREGVEVIRAGMLGPVKEVHIWTNRPIWPQAPQVMSIPAPAPVPPTLHWEEWLGTAADRPYSPAYQPFKWRGFWDFGTGALGDMGCHTANLPFMALNLEYPTSLQGEAGDLNPISYPSWARVNYEFAARKDMPPVKVTWYEGKKDGKLVHPPEELVEKVLAEYGKLPHNEKKNKKNNDKPLALNNSGAIVVGEKGIMYSPHDYGGEWFLLPVDAYKDYKAPEQTLPRNPDGGDEGQKLEWLAAMKGGPAAMANFDYAGLLAEFILLGNVAIKNSGKKLEWDGPNMKFPNAPEAEASLRREYRQGYSLKTST